MRIIRKRKLGRREFLQEATTAAAIGIGSVAFGVEPAAAQNAEAKAASKDFPDEHRRAEARLRDWLYPGAEGGGGGAYGDDVTMGQLQYQTSDPLPRIRAYYWKKILPGRSERPGSHYKLG